MTKKEKKPPKPLKFFSAHKDEDFQAGFAPMVQKSYSELFELHGKDAWKLSKSDLVTFFRNADQTSAAIGARQAGVFMVLSGQAGKSDIALKSKAAAEAGPKKAVQKKKKMTYL